MYESQKRYYEKNKVKINAKKSNWYWNFKRQYGVSYYAYRQTLKTMDTDELIKTSLNILRKLDGTKS